MMQGQGFSSRNVFGGSEFDSEEEDMDAVGPSGGGAGWGNFGPGAGAAAAAGGHAFGGGAPGAGQQGVAPGFQGGDIRDYSESDSEEDGAFSDDQGPAPSVYGTETNEPARVLPAQFRPSKFAALPSRVFTRKDYEETKKSSSENVVIDPLEQPFIDIPPFAQDELLLFAMENYAKDKFVQPKLSWLKSLQKKKVTLNELLQYVDVTDMRNAKTFPHIPLTEISKDDRRLMIKEATQAFRNTTGYMGDRSSGKRTYDHFHKLISYCIKAPDSFRDEVYCQIIKQTTNNPSRESNRKGWELLCGCCSVFPPSEELLRYLEAYLANAVRLVEGSGGDEQIAEWARYAYHCLQMTILHGERTQAPSKAEWEALLGRRDTHVMIELLDGTRKVVMCGPQTTCQDVADMLMKGLGIIHAKSFCLAEAETPPPSEVLNRLREQAKLSTRRNHMPVEVIRHRVIDKDERLLDVFSTWEHDKQQDDQGLRRQFKFVFKVRYFLREEEKTQSRFGKLIYFVQAAHDVSAGFYHIPEKSAVRLAALRVQAHFGVNEEEFYTAELIEKELDLYISSRWSAKRDRAYLAHRVMLEHKDWVNLSQFEAQQKYLEFLHDHPTYGCTWFHCKKIPRVKHGLHYEDLLVGISEKGVFLMSEESRKLKQVFELSDIQRYGCRNSKFVLVAGNLVTQKTYELNTFHSREMNDLLHFYIEKQVVFEEMGG